MNILNLNIIIKQHAVTRLNLILILCQLVVDENFTNYVDDNVPQYSILVQANYLYNNNYSIMLK